MKKQTILLFLSLLAGILTGFASYEPIHIMAREVSDLFLRFLRLLCTPIIFLSIISTISGMKNIQEMKIFGWKTLRYTLVTTVIAALVGLVLFELIQPASSMQIAENTTSFNSSSTYLDAIKQLIPENIFQAFSENNVIGVAFISFLLGFATLLLPKENQSVINQFFSSIFAAFLKIAGFIVLIVPIGIWAFTTLFILDLSGNDLQISTLGWYIVCVVAANLIQGIIILPAFVKKKGISPFSLFKAMSQALTIAFFSKSSNAALPITMRCAEEKFGIPRKVSNFTFPLCSVINMNACAAFILITVLFVGTQSGMSFSFYAKIGWVILASIAAVGNAGVPMGCYFLASAFLSGMGVPLRIMGLILPIYAFLDMLETAINVWSDSCITAVVAKDLQKQEISEETIPSYKTVVEKL